MAATVLHNFLMRNKDSSYFTPDLIDHYNGDELILGEWRNEDEQLEKYKPCMTNNATREAFSLRDQLKNFIVGK